MIVFYDADCGFCRWSAEKLLAWDRTKELSALPIQGEEAQHLLRDMDPELRMASAHVVAPDGHVYSGGAIADPLLRSLPGARLLAAIARTLPKTTEHIYRSVARHRDQLGRWVGVDACSV